MLSQDIEYFSETFKNIIGVNPQIAKHYLKQTKKITSNQIKVINHAIIELYKLKQFKEKYLLNEKPNILPTKKLTIFK